MWMSSTLEVFDLDRQLAQTGSRRVCSNWSLPRQRSTVAIQAMSRPGGAPATRVNSVDSVHQNTVQLMGTRRAIIPALLAIVAISFR